MNGYITGIACGIIVWTIGYFLAPAPTNNGGSGYLGDLPVFWRQILRWLLGLVTVITFALLCLQGYDAGSFNFIWEFIPTFLSCLVVYFVVRYKLLLK